MKSKMKNVKRTINRTIEDSDCSSMATLKRAMERERNVKLKRGLKWTSTL